MGAILSMVAGGAKTGGADTVTSKATVTSKRSNGSVAETGKAVSQTEEETAATKRVYENPHPGQCGLEPDGPAWFPYVVPPRIKETRATPEEAARYQGHIDAIMHEDTLAGVRVDFEPDDILEVFIRVQEYLNSEPVLIEDVPRGTTVVGDLHGQLYDLARVFRAHDKDGKPGYLCAKYLFLGNYVDKGQQSIEVLMLLFSLKILYPDNFILLRGSHEFADVNGVSGLAEECKTRWINKVALEIFCQANETFCFLSIAAIIGNFYLCVSGGISPREMVRSQLRGLRKPIIRSGDDHLVHDIVWSDPIVGVKGTMFNYDRGTSIFYGLDALVWALHNMDCMALMRGHSLVRTGFDNQWDICFTIYSATGDNNDGAFAVVELDGSCSVVIMEKNLERIAWMKSLLPASAQKVVDNETTGEISVYKGI